MILRNIFHHTFNKVNRVINPTQYSTKDFQKSVQVCILGANTDLGTHTAFLMKQNPLISALHLQGCKPLDNVGVDLNFCDTKCRVHTHLGESVDKAVKSADIILILPAINLKEDTPIGERVMKEGQRLYTIVKQCASFAPRTILVNCVPPVSVTTALVSEVFKKTHFYHPGRIVGSAAIAQVKTNTILARYQDLDPAMCHVPLIGGPDIDLAVPLFSRARPVEVVGNGPKVLTALIRGVKEDDFPKTASRPNFVQNCNLAESYGLNMLVSTIALGICGDPKAFANVYLRSGAISTCKYLVSTVRFSRGGVVHNCGVPELTNLELQLFEKATLEIKEREQMAKDFLEYFEHTGKYPKIPPFKEKEAKAEQLLNQKIVR